jgi:hypothetical protein
VLAVSPVQLTAQEAVPQPRVIPVYLIPQDLVFDYRRLRLHVQAVQDVRRWYGRALNGPTFDADPVIVHQSRHTFDEFAADDFQAWWPLLQQEFADLGLPQMGESRPSPRRGSLTRAHSAGWS